MKKIFVAIMAIIIVSNIINAKDSKKYGKEISLKEKTSISKILENPEEFVGKKVLVEGTVVGVCAKRGCWMDISGEKDFEKIKVKVNDGEIVFPMEAKGKKALVEGEVYSIVVEGEECGENCSKKDKKDEQKHKHEKTTKKVYQIKGLGAEIQ